MRRLPEADARAPAAKAGTMMAPSAHERLGRRRGTKEVSSWASEVNRAVSAKAAASSRTVVRFVQNATLFSAPPWISGSSLSLIVPGRAGIVALVAKDPIKL